MLQRWNLPTPSLSGLVEHECPRCHREVELPLGALCSSCRIDIERRARRVARIVSLASTAVVGFYVFLRMPDNEQARLVAIAGVLVWLILSNVTVRRVMREWKR